jgi:hypothetical protein
MKWITMILVALFALAEVSTVAAGPPHRRRQQWSPESMYQPAWNTGYQQVPAGNWSPPVSQPLPSEGVRLQDPAGTAYEASPASATGSDDALAEVNQYRARRGLRPFLKDALLTIGAANCAKQRAARLCTGHLPESDFSYLPPGAQASAGGCAAWEPSWGWGSCCANDNYQFAGAAWTLGRDGKRYMHLFVR